MFCTHCGKELPNDSIFCTECGAKLEIEPSGETPTEVMPSAIPMQTPPAPNQTNAAPVTPKIPRWVPLAAAAVVLGGVLIGIIAAFAMNGNSGSESTDSPATPTNSAVEVSRSEDTTTTEELQPTSPNTQGATVRLGAYDGAVALFNDNEVSPYQITEVKIKDLDPELAAKIGSGLTYENEHDALVQLEVMRQNVAEAQSIEEQKKIEEEAAKIREEEKAKQAEADAAKKKAEEEARNRNNYVIADSASRYLSASELSSYTSDELSIAQNEIWARHGRMFNNNWLQNTFNSKSWYNGTITPDNFLNVYKPTDIEDANSKLIAEELSRRGYDVNSAHPN